MYVELNLIITYKLPASRLPRTHCQSNIMQLASPDLDGLFPFVTFFLSLIQLLGSNWKALLLSSFLIWSVTVFTRRAKQSKDSSSLLVEGSPSPRVPLNGSDIPSIHHHPYSQTSDRPTSKSSSQTQKKDLMVKGAQKQDHRVKPPYDAFLVLDVEATCEEGTGFEWPNEIIVRLIYHYTILFTPSSWPRLTYIGVACLSHALEG